MSSIKVSALTAKTTPSGSEELLINDGGTSKKITIANLPDNDTTYSNFAGTTAGLVPTSTTGDDTKFLRADGTWVVPTDTDTGITDVVDDTSPQLGGNLDFQTHKATSFTSTGIDDNSTSTAITIDSSEKVSIGGSGSVSSDSQVAIKGGNLELTTAGAKYWIPRASDGVLTGSLYSPSGSVVRLSGAGTSAGTIEFEPRSSNGVIARVTGDGLCFGSDTVAANALDDYEEGTTNISAAPNGITYSIASATGNTYTKIGNLVTFRAKITYGAHTADNNILYVNIPFASAANCEAVGKVGVNTFGGTQEGIYVHISGGSNFLTVRGETDNIKRVDSASQSFQFSITYQAA